MASVLRYIDAGHRARTAAADTKQSNNKTTTSFVRNMNDWYDD